MPCKPVDGFANLSNSSLLIEDKPTGFASDMVALANLSTTALPYCKVLGAFGFLGSDIAMPRRALSIAPSPP